MTWEQGIPTRFGTLHWLKMQPSGVWREWWALVDPEAEEGSHAAAVHPADGHVVVFHPSGEWPGGYTTSLDKMVSGATLEQLIDIAMIELIGIGTIDPLALAAQCAE